jgi:hypothetical protein
VATKKKPNQFTEWRDERQPARHGRRSGSRRAAAAPYNQRMVRPSRDRLTHLGRDLVDALARSRAVVLLKDREAVQQAVAQALADELRREEERETSARRRIASMRGAPRQDTKEWEELFRKFVEEEYLREGLDS